MAFLQFFPRCIGSTLELLTTFFPTLSEREQLEDLFKWYGDLLDEIDKRCEANKPDGSDWENKSILFDKEWFKQFLKCYHREGVSFDSLLSRKAIAVCSYVSTVIFFKCFLFVSGVAMEKFKVPGSVSDVSGLTDRLSSRSSLGTDSGKDVFFKLWKQFRGVDDEEDAMEVPYQRFLKFASPNSMNTESVSDMSGLTDRLSSLSNKWNWSLETDSCEDGVLEIWNEHISCDDNKEDAMKMLYQLIHGTLTEVTRAVDREVGRLGGVGDLHAEARRAKWGDELCELLQILDVFLESADTEFLYEEFYDWFCYTADRLLTSGGERNRARARELLDAVKKKLDSIGDDTIFVPKWGNNQRIEYQSLALDPVEKYKREYDVLRRLWKATGQYSYLKDMHVSREQAYTEVERRWGDDSEKLAFEKRRIGSLFDRRLHDIMDMVNGERYSEAEKTVKELDQDRCRSNGTSRNFLELLDLDTLPSWNSSFEAYASDLPAAHRGRLGQMAYLQFVPGLMQPLRTELHPSLSGPELTEQLKWYGYVLDSIDECCEVKKPDGSDWENKSVLFDKEEFEQFLKCYHREGVSFDSLLSRKAIAVCSYVHTVIFIKCFLSALRLALERFKDSESVSEMSGLTDRLSSLSNKWNSCEGGVLELWNDWKKHTSDVEKEDAMKMLYQWIRDPLTEATDVYFRDVGLLEGSLHLHAEAMRAKWGDELCKLLLFLDKFLKSDDTEFLYEEIHHWFLDTASWFLRLGNHNRARELLEVVKQKHDDGEDDTIFVPKWENNQRIEYQSLTSDPLLFFWRKSAILDSLWRVTGKFSYFEDNLKGSERLYGDDSKKRESVKLQMEALFDQQLSQTREIERLVRGERYIEAKEKFKQLDQVCKSHLLLESFFEILNSFEPPSWESFCEKQNFFLDVSEDLGSSQMTAKLLQQYGCRIGCRSFGRLPEMMKGDLLAYGISFDFRPEVGEVPSVELWLKEELNLDLTSSAPTSIQEVISCLEDDCSADEHKRELPNMLKACRLLKRSIDIYSNLLHDWTQGSSNEDEWLQLLETQKSVHDTLKSYLLVVYFFCCESMPENEDHITYGASQALETLKASAIVWVERGRTRTLLSQLGPWYGLIKHRDENPGSLKDELIRFDKDVKEAMNSILHSCQLACSSSSKPLFVEYVNLGDMYAAFFVEVVGGEMNTHISDTLGVLVDSEEDFLGAFSEKLQLAGEDLADSALEKLPDEDLEKLADPTTVNKLLYVFYEILPRQKNSNKECVVAKLHSILERLYDILIRPFWERKSYNLREPKSPIIFVPDKTLYKVPFALLRDKETKKYLFELHTISIAPSLRVLQHCARRLHHLENFPLKPKCILAVGDPAYDIGPRLRGTGKELEHLRECFPGRVKGLEKHEATRSKFLDLVKEASSNKDGHVFAFMHLGVHGHWSEDDPHKTGSLQFAKPLSTEINLGQSHTSELEPKSGEETISNNDGKRYRSAFGEVGATTRARGWRSSATDSAMLPSNDIVKSGIEWLTRLVVLSACNSSRGQGYYDCEVNLPRALMIAGVPTAVVTQWKIGDDASPVLMKAFYERLRNGEDVASALRSAMILTRQCSDSADNIFQWGSFVVWGLPSVTLPDELLHDNAKAQL